MCNYFSFSYYQQIITSNATSRVNLSGTNLRGADLKGAKLSEVDLSGADLSGADLRDAELGKVSYKGTIMPDGTVHN